MESLAGYREIEKRREQILLALVEAAQAERPPLPPEGGSANVTPVAPREEDLGRWKALSTSVPVALSRLTGREAGTLDDWVALVEAKRGDLGSLFAQPGA